MCLASVSPSSIFAAHTQTPSKGQNHKMSAVVLSRGPGQGRAQNRTFIKQSRGRWKTATRIPPAGPWDLPAKFGLDIHAFNLGSNLIRNHKWGLKEMVASETREWRPRVRNSLNPQGFQAWRPEECSDQQRWWWPTAAVWYFSLKPWIAGPREIKACP